MDGIVTVIRFAVSNIMAFAVFWAGRVNDSATAKRLVVGWDFVLRFLPFPLVLPHGSRESNGELPNPQCDIQTYQLESLLGHIKNSCVSYCFCKVPIDSDYIIPFWNNIMQLSKEVIVPQ